MAGNGSMIRHKMKVDDVREIRVCFTKFSSTKRGICLRILQVTKFNGVTQTAYKNGSAYGIRIS